MDTLCFLLVLSGDLGIFGRVVDLKEVIHSCTGVQEESLKTMVALYVEIPQSSVYFE